MQETVRLAWVDAAKGISILLVVMMYAAYNTGEYTGGVGFLHYIIGFATPFRMPEFFLISGLFLSQVIDRPFLRFADRRVVHYLYFYILWVAIMIGLKVGIYDADPIGTLRGIGFALIQPYGVLWFVYLLALFGLVTKLLYDSAVPAWVTLPVAIALQLWSPHSESYILTQFAAYFVFFYLGYLAAPAVLALVDRAQHNPAAASIGLVVWALVNGLLVFSPGYVVEPVGMQMGLAALPGLHFVLAVIGTLALCVAAGLAVQFRFMAWLTWLGKHSLVVYLFFTIPMSLSRALALKSGIIADIGIISTFVMVASIASSVILYGLIQLTGIGKFLFERPRWAHLPASRSAVGVGPATDTQASAAKS
jgi:uncharacterized membrane protein YcfT